MLRAIVIVHAPAAQRNEHVLHASGVKHRCRGGQIAVRADVHAGEQAGLGAVGLDARGDGQDALQPLRLEGGYRVGKHRRGYVLAKKRKRLRAQVGVRHHQPGLVEKR